MYGTELATQRKRILDARINETLGTARQAGYWDIDELMSLVAVGSHYASHRGVATFALAKGLVREGYPVEKVAAAYGLDATALANWSVSQVLLAEDLKQQILDDVAKLVPETPEPQRFVKAVHKVGTLTTDNGVGRPSPTDVSPAGSLHFAR